MPPFSVITAGNFHDLAAKRKMERDFTQNQRLIAMGFRVIFILIILPRIKALAKPGTGHPPLTVNPGQADIICLPVVAGKLVQICAFHGDFHPVKWTESPEFGLGAGLDINGFQITQKLRCQLLLGKIAKRHASYPCFNFIDKVIEVFLFQFGAGDVVT